MRSCLPLTGKTTSALHRDRRDFHQGVDGDPVRSPGLGEPDHQAVPGRAEVVNQQVVRDVGSGRLLVYRALTELEFLPEENLDFPDPDGPITAR